MCFCACVCLSLCFCSCCGKKGWPRASHTHLQDKHQWTCQLDVKWWRRFGWHYPAGRQKSEGVRCRCTRSGKLQLLERRRAVVINLSAAGGWGGRRVRWDAHFICHLFYCTYTVNNKTQVKGWNPCLWVWVEYFSLSLSLDREGNWKLTHCESCCDGLPTCSVFVKFSDPFSFFPFCYFAALC